MNAPVSARHARSLSRSILVTVLAFTLVAVVATAIALVTVAYFSEEERSEGLLVEQARSCAQVLEEYPVDARVGVLEHQFAGPERFTLIDPAGNVIFDTAGQGWRPRKPLRTSGDARRRACRRGGCWCAIRIP